MNKPSSFSKEGIEAVLSKLRAVIADPHATDEDTKAAKKALAFFGETGKLSEQELSHSRKESAPAHDDNGRQDRLLPLLLRFAIADNR